VSFTFHTPSKALSARTPKLVTPNKQVAITAAIAAFLIFIPPCNLDADANGALSMQRFRT
jgi:hypothetical protein